MACKCKKKRAAKVAGMARRKKNSMSTLVTTGLAVAGGFAAGKAVSKIPFIAANPIVGIVAPVAGAIVTPMLLGKTATAGSLAAGMIAAAATSAVGQFAPTVANQIGLSGIPYRSLDIPGVGSSPAPKIRY